MSKKKRLALPEPTGPFTALVYLAPLGNWAWRISQGNDDLLRGAGYANWAEARVDCQEFLNGYDGEAEIVVEHPVFE